MSGEGGMEGMRGKGRNESGEKEEGMRGRKRGRDGGNVGEGKE